MRHTGDLYYIIFILIFLVLGCVYVNVRELFFPSNAYSNNNNIARRPENGNKKCVSKTRDQRWAEYYNINNIIKIVITGRGEYLTSDLMLH